MDKAFSRPANICGTGGTTIFWNLIYVMQGSTKVGHRFYKAHDINDFPQEQKKLTLA